MIERFNPRHKEGAPTEPFDSYKQTFGVRMTLRDLLDIRELEDDLIELEHIGEEDRYPIPFYLQAEWDDYLRDHKKAS